MVSHRTVTTSYSPCSWAVSLAVFSMPLGKPDRLDMFAVDNGGDYGAVMKDVAVVISAMSIVEVEE